jgi:hypothetical protein
MALAECGVGEQIIDLDTEASQAATLLRLYYDPLRQAVLEDSNWQFARKYAALGLVDTDDGTQPWSTEWTYTYQVPSDCIRVRRLVDGLGRPELNGTPASYQLGGGTTRLIYTDLETATAEYTYDVTDPAMFSPSFVAAFSVRLGSQIATALSRLKGKDESLLKKYLLLISQAQANDANSRVAYPPLDAEAVRIRGAE